MSAIFDVVLLSSGEGVDAALCFSRSLKLTGVRESRFTDVGDSGVWSPVIAMFASMFLNLVVRDGLESMLVYNNSSTGVGRVTPCFKLHGLKWRKVSITCLSICNMSPLCRLLRHSLHAALDSVPVAPLYNIDL